MKTTSLFSVQKRVNCHAKYITVIIVLWSMGASGSLLYDSQFMSRVEVNQVQNFLFSKKQIDLKRKGGKRNELPIDIAIRYSPYADEIVPLYVSAGSPLRYSAEWRGNIFHTIAQSYNEDEERLVRVFHFVLEHLSEVIDQRVKKDLKTHLINQYDQFGFAPLHYLSTKDKPLLLKAYLKAGADVNLPTLSEKHTPLMLAFGNSKGEHFDQVLEILLSHGANAEIKGKDGVTAMHFAFGADSLSGVMMLYVSGAKLNSRNNDGDTPLDQHGYQVLRDFLRKRDFKLTMPKTDASIKNNSCREGFSS